MRLQTLVVLSVVSSACVVGLDEPQDAGTSGGGTAATGGAVASGGGTAATGGGGVTATGGGTAATGGGTATGGGAGSFDAGVDAGTPVIADGGLTAACTREPRLSGRSDLVFCEGWEQADWWQHPVPWVANARKTPRSLDLATAASVANTSIETTPGVCRQGNCLKVNTPAGSNLGVSLHWPLRSAQLAPERLFARYYLKLGSTWTPSNCTPGTMNIVSEGGKFPGLVDVRVNGDPEAPDGQCGNGGAQGDGINCWSHRAFFGGCETGNGGLSVCTTKPGAKARFGGYIYHGNGVDNRSFEAAPWDSDYWTQFSGSGCESDPFDLFCTLPIADRGTSAADPRNLLHNDGVLGGTPGTRLRSRFK